MCLQLVFCIHSLSFGGDSSYLTVIHPHYSPSFHYTSFSTPLHKQKTSSPNGLFFTHAFFHTFQWYIYFSYDEFTPRISSISPHRPLVVAVQSGNRVDLHVLAVGAFIPAPFCSGIYVRSSLRTPTLHSAYI